MEEMDEAHPLQALSRKMIRNLYNGPFERKAQGCLDYVRRFQCDGAVQFCHWGCKQSAGSALLMKKRMLPYYQQISNKDFYYLFTAADSDPAAMIVDNGTISWVDIQNMSDGTLKVTTLKDGELNTATYQYLSDEDVNGVTYACVQNRSTEGIQSVPLFPEPAE